MGTEIKVKPKKTNKQKNKQQKPNPKTCQTKKRDLITYNTIIVTFSKAN